MTKYIDQEREKYWPVSSELLAQYKDGSHTEKYAGYLLWRKDGQRHRDGDKPAVIFLDGCLEWFQNDLVHRDGDKPAWISAGGSLYWYQNGNLHRFRGPAQIYKSGKLEWWIHGVPITQEVNEWLAGEKWCGTPEQIVEFQLRFT